MSVCKEAKKIIMIHTENEEKRSCASAWMAISNKEHLLFNRKILCSTKKSEKKKCNENKNMVINVG